MLKFFGLLLDWLMTRDWLRVSVLLIPIATTLLLFAGAVMGSRQNRDQMASMYIDIGSAELEEKEVDWAFAFDALGDDGTLAATSNPNDDVEVSRFTEAAFRRAQELQFNNQRARFVVGAILGNRGAIAEAFKVMQSIAPTDDQGYIPAHAWIANALLQQDPFPPEQQTLLEHHLGIGIQMESAPAQLLFAATQLALDKRQNLQAIDLLKKSAEQQPEFEGELFRLALQLGNTRVAEQTAEKALPRIMAGIEDGSATVADRITASEILFHRGDFEGAKAILTNSLTTELEPERQASLKRALSELFRQRFGQTLDYSSTTWSAEISFLDQALRIDPNNPRIAETVAFLARIGGDTPPVELVQQLQTFLGQGKATPLTHYWLGEMYVLREEYESAIGHYRNVVSRLPESGLALNNLAYAISLSDPDQLEDALELIGQAIQLNPLEADFYDTKASILVQMDRLPEAAAEMDKAIELSPANSSFHQRLSDIYEASGNQQLADVHAQRVAELLSQDGESSPTGQP